MFSRRSLLALVAAVVLAGCAEAPLLEDGASRSFAVRNVTVDTSQFVGVKGRVNEFSREEVARDIRATVTHRLRRAAKGSQPVDVKVYVQKVSLVSPGQSFLVGGTSSIRGVLEVKDARSGAEVLAPTEVFGTAKGTYAPGGIIGVLTTRNVDDDYKQTVAGFASDVELRLFGTKAGEPVRTASRDTEANTASEAAQVSGKDASVHRAELDARAKHGAACHTLACEQDVARARKEAAPQVQRAATQSHGASCRNSITIYCKDTSSGAIKPNVSPELN